MTPRDPGLELSARLGAAARALVAGQPLDTAPLSRELRAFARDALTAGDQATAELAIACARCLDLFVQDALGGPEALPLLAAAADTLSSDDVTALSAARYELETFFPALGDSARPPQSPDVPVTSLRRRRDH